MKFHFLTTIIIVIFALVSGAHAQKRSVGGSLTKPRLTTARSAAVGQTAVVIDETLAVLREKPSLFSLPLQRVSRGRRLQILGSRETDGVTFYRAAVRSNVGWIQADAVFGKFRPGDEERLAKLIQASDGFDQIEMAVEFFMMYPASRFRPTILVLYGDLLEDIAAKLSKDANSRLSKREMAASAAPLHSYYLNFVSLDRYRKLGVVFLFNSATKQFHYDGASWAEIVSKHAGSPEASEAKKRLDVLKQKMEKTTAVR